MMACSYLSATSFKPESSASCWTLSRGEPGQNAFRLKAEMDSMELILQHRLSPNHPAMTIQSDSVVQRQLNDQSMTRNLLVST